MWNGCQWLNEPKRWSVTPQGLQVTTDQRTDFWRETHYGFVRHSGHCFGARVDNDFTATVRVQAKYQSLYDQAGLMILVDERNWIKVGAELSDGQVTLSSVLTLGQSDWATGAFPGDASDFWLRATLDSGVLRMQVSTDGKRWPLMRLCPFAHSGSYFIGPMCCTPEREGLEVLFPEFEVTPPAGKRLHDLS